MIDLNEIGAWVTTDAAGQSSVRLGLYLPGIKANDGFRVIARVIHREDRFTADIPAQNYDLTWVAGSANDLWTVTTPIAATPGAPASTHFGQAGSYLYRFQLLRGGNVLVPWFTDPFARATDIGELAAFTVPAAGVFDFADDAFLVPAIDDCIVYELQVDEFNGTFDGVVERLPYLQGLGVNVLELMPVTSPKIEYDWGYGPLHFFAPDARAGGPDGLRRLIKACHAAKVAVILDVVYQHVDPEFAYKQVYDAAGRPSPMVGSDGQFGPQADFTQAFTRDYFLAANRHWLEQYHVDGFRYDNVDGFYDGPVGEGFAALAYRTYQLSLPMARFGDGGGPSRIIQCAEALSQPRGILRDTYATAAWQDELLNKAEDMAAYGYVDDTFAHLLDTSFCGYPAANSIPAQVAPFQYIESHDHSRLITFCGLLPDPVQGDIHFGDRRLFYMLQPFAIALYTCQGAPMLWQGQEFAEYYTVAPAGNARVSFRRDVHWELFYDPPGQALVRLYRILGGLRRSSSALRSRDSFYYNTLDTARCGVVIYRRRATNPDELAVVCLNFSADAQDVAVPFYLPGVYREMLDDGVRMATGVGHYDITIGAQDELRQVSVPSHYGYVFVRQ